ncbi:MAG: hypothetical protein QM817_39430 [Archangium sp.]
MKTSFHNARTATPVKNHSSYLRNPPPPPNKHGSTTHAPPPPPGPKATMAPPPRMAPPPPPSTSRMAPPPPPQRDAFSSGVASHSSSIIGTGSSVPQAFTQSLKGMTNERLQQLASHLQMEMVISRFMGNPAAAQRAEAKLGAVNGELVRRSEVKKQKTEYANSLTSMSSGDLEKARAQEFLALFNASTRGDADGISNAQDKLKLLDGEMTRRESELSAFSGELTGMDESQLDDLGTQLATQLLGLILNPKPQDSQVESIFNRLGMLMGEQIGRGLVSSGNDWLFSK